MKVAFYVTDQNGKRLTKTIEDNMQYKNTDIIEEQDHPGDVESRLTHV